MSRVLTRASPREMSWGLQPPDRVGLRSLPDETRRGRAWARATQCPASAVWHGVAVPHSRCCSVARCWAGMLRANLARGELCCVGGYIYGVSAVARLVLVPNRPGNS